MQSMLRMACHRFTLLCFLLSAAWAVAQEPPLSGVLITPEDRSAQLKLEENWPELEKVAANWATVKETDWEAWYYYGLAQLRLGKVEQALTSLDLAYRLSREENDELILLLGDAYSAAQRWQDAERFYRRLLESYPDNPPLWDKLRYVMEEYLLLAPPNAEQAREELIEILDKLLMYSSHIKDDTLWLRYAMLLDEAGKMEKARYAYGQLLLLRPTDLAVLEWLFRYDVKNADEAALQETIARLRRVSKDNPLLHVYMGQQALAAGDEREARRHYNLISQNNNYPYEQALALSGLGDLAGGARHGEAFEYYKRAINADPSYLYAWERIVVILRAQKRYRLADRYFIRLRQVQKFVETGQQVQRSVLNGIE